MKRKVSRVIAMMMVMAMMILSFGNNIGLASETTDNVTHEEDNKISCFETAN